MKQVKQTSTHEFLRSYESLCNIQVKLNREELALIHFKMVYAMSGVKDRVAESSIFKSFQDSSSTRLAGK